MKLIPHFRHNISYFFRDKKGPISKNVAIFIAKVGNKKVNVSHEHRGFRWLGEKEALRQNTYKDFASDIKLLFDYISRYETMLELNSEYSKLPSKHKNWDLSKKLVPGEGPLNAQTMFVGQAPGANEDILRKPFVGRSGQVLSRMIKVAKMNREKCYICSVVQFFPPKNRGPTKWEIAECEGFLKRQIEIVKPKRIVLLGNFACNALLGYDKVNQNHGRFVKKDGRDYFITFHPAMALRSSKRVAALMEQDFGKLAKK